MLNVDLIIGFSSLAIAGVAYLVTRELSMLGGVFVNYLLVIIGVLSVVEIFTGFVKPDRIRFFESAGERNNILIGLIILAAYLILLPFIGFLPASYCFYFGFNLFLGENRWQTRNILQSAGLSAVVVTVFYFVFSRFLGVPLPEGALFQ